jgi:hypothetical protein
VYIFISSFAERHDVRGENDTVRTIFTPLLVGMEEDKEFLGQ